MARRCFFNPFSLLMIGFLFLVLLFLIPFLFLSLIGSAFAKLGFSPLMVLLLLLFTLVGSLVNIPLIIPTTALGLSLALFWGGTNSSGAVAIVLVILGHISFTYPLVVRNITGAVEEVDPAFEETALTLGAKPLETFNKVLFPVIKSSVIAGAILAFTRSLGETGATVAISSNVNTAPVYIVNLVKAGADSYPAAAMCSIVLIAICFVLMFAVRALTHRGSDRNA